jgi:AcrR family transcriptional regulator
MSARDPHDTEGHRAARRVRLPAAERREAILRAAAVVFAEAGYRAARVADVAARVGVTEPVVFQNFGSKAALFAAVVERAAAQAGDSLDELAAAPDPVHGLLAHVLAAGAPGRPGDAAPPAEPPHAEPPGSGPHAGTAFGVLFADAVALAADPGLAGPARDAVRTIAAHLADLVRHAQARGGARPDADPEAAAWLLLSVLSARRLRAAAMPPALEPTVAALALGALAPLPAPACGSGKPPPGTGSAASPALLPRAVVPRCEAGQVPCHVAGQPPVATPEQVHDRWHEQHPDNDRDEDGHDHAGPRPAPLVIVAYQTGLVSRRL